MKKNKKITNEWKLYYEIFNEMKMELIFHIAGWLSSVFADNNVWLTFHEWWMKLVSDNLIYPQIIT